MSYFVSLIIFHKPLALVLHTCCLPVAKKHPAVVPLVSCRSPVALLPLSHVASLSLRCRFQSCCPPVVFLSLSCCVSCRYGLFPVASLLSPYRHPVDALSPTCCPPVATCLSPSCRLSVTSCRFPAAFLPLSCRLPGTILSSSCRQIVAFLSHLAAFPCRLLRAARICWMVGTISLVCAPGGPHQKLQTSHRLVLLSPEQRGQTPLQLLG